MTAIYQFLILSVVIGGLAIALRLVFGNDRRPVPDLDGTDFGLLSEVAVVPTEEAAKVLIERLRRNGVRATTTRGQPYRVMVFPDDVPDAKLVLREGNT